MKNVIKEINEAITNGALVDSKLKFSGNKENQTEWSRAKDFFGFYRKHFLEAPVTGITDVKLCSIGDKWVIEITITEDYQGGE